MTDPLDRIDVSLTRIAAALDRLSPPPAVTATATGHWFVARPHGLVAVPPPRTTPLVIFAGIDAQRAQLHENARRHAAALPAHDVLLWGARGMGKSALVRAVHADLVAGGTDSALVQFADPDLSALPALLGRLGADPRRFTVFIDDITLDCDSTIHALRSLLDGGIAERSDNVRVAVTSNRRALAPRSLAENDPISPRDTADDSLALADRFGLRLGFHVCDQADYLTMCRNHAAAHGLGFDAAAALAWAAGRGGRSGRAAWQFTVETAGAAGVVLA